jgi:hypothetical protein
MFRKFLKKILKNLNSLKKSLKHFKIPIFKDNSLKVRALNISIFCSHVTGPDQGFLVSRLVLTRKPWERGWQLPENYKENFDVSSEDYMSFYAKNMTVITWSVSVF